jgi:hypothetical protein
VSGVRHQVAVSATGWSLGQRSPTECGVSKWVWLWSPENGESHDRKMSWKVPRTHARTHTHTQRNIQGVIFKMASLITLGSDFFTWRAVSQWSPMFQFAMSRGLRVHCSY